MYIGYIRRSDIVVPLRKTSFSYLCWVIQLPEVFRDFPQPKKHLREFYFELAMIISFPTIYNQSLTRKLAVKFSEMLNAYKCQPRKEGTSKSDEIL